MYYDKVDWSEKEKKEINKCVYMRMWGYGNDWIYLYERMGINEDRNN